MQLFEGHAYEYLLKICPYLNMVKEARILRNCSVCVNGIPSRGYSTHSLARMKFIILCLLFALLAVYAKAEMTDEFNSEEEIAPIRVKRQWGYGWGWGRPWGWRRPWGWGGMYGGWGYPFGGYWG